VHNGAPAPHPPWPRLAIVWIDVPAGAGEGHWIPAEGVALRRVLADLRTGGADPSSIRVVSPFREVADQARFVYRDVFGGAAEHDRERWVGTVNTVRAGQADTVVLVLGGDPGRPAARRFAIVKPNLVNVALTSARRRLYVIGNTRTWGNEPYFAELADECLVRR
jgi:hypothetical protein